MMIRFSFAVTAIALGATFASPHASAGQAKSPYFGGELTGIFQTADLGKVTPKPAAFNIVDCNGPTCPHLQKAHNVQKSGKLRP